MAGFLRKRALFLAVISFFIVARIACAEPPAPAESEETQAEQEPNTEDLLSLKYGKLIIDDTWHILTSPLHWDKKDWLVAGLSTGTAAAVMVWADKPIEKAFQKNRTDANNKFSRAIQPFGSTYSFGVLGAFELGGMAFHDDNARAVAQDGLVSSLIAAGIITHSLKYSIGRKRPRKNDGPFEFINGGSAFPSGHVTQAFAVASVIAEHYDSPLIKIGAYGLAGAVAYARMEQRAHWASDVLAGALIGTFVGRGVVHFNRDKRYELSVIADEDMVGAQLTHKF